MPLIYRHFLSALFLIVAGTSSADESFYQIVDPDGHIRIIRNTNESAGTKKNEGADTTPPRLDAKVVEKETSSKPQEPVVTVAPYDGDAYVDSETLEATGFNPEKKKRFYIVNDGLGSHMSSSDGSVVTRDESMSEEKTVNKEVASSPLSAPVLAVSADEALVKWPALPSCMPLEVLAGSATIDHDVAAVLILDKRAYGYLDAAGVIATYQIAGYGIRTIILRSFSNTDKSPAFVRPYLALFNRQGCLSRVLTSYYERSYPATQSRHPMLEGGLTIHSEERFLLVMTAMDENATPVTDYKLSKYGQLKLTFHK